MLGAESGLKISERRRNRVTRLYSNPSKGAICCYAVKHRIGELKPLWLHRDRKKIQRKVREHWHWLRKFQTIEVSWGEGVLSCNVVPDNRRLTVYNIWRMLNKRQEIVDGNQYP